MDLSVSISMRSVNPIVDTIALLQTLDYFSDRVL